MARAAMVMLAEPAATVAQVSGLLPIGRATAAMEDTAAQAAMAVVAAAARVAREVPGRLLAVLAVCQLRPLTVRADKE